MRMMPRVLYIVGGVVIAAVVGMIVLGIVASSGLIRPDFADRLAMSLMGLLPAGAASLPQAMVVDRGRWKRLMLSGIVAAAVAWLAALPWFWLDVIPPMVTPDDVPLVMWIIAPTTLSGCWSIWTAVAAIVVLIPCRSRPAGVVRRLTLGFAAITVLTIVSGALGTPWHEAHDDIRGAHYWVEGHWRVGWAGGSLMMLGMAWLLTLGFMPRVLGDPIPDDQRVKVSLTCPRCGEAGALRTAGDTCGGCGLWIRIGQP